MVDKKKCNSGLKSIDYKNLEILNVIEGRLLRRPKAGPGCTSLYDHHKHFASSARWRTKLHNIVLFSHAAAVSLEVGLKATLVRLRVKPFEDQSRTMNRWSLRNDAVNI